MSKSYDLSTSSKWANLADGEHTVKIKATGSGYGTSSFSNSVTVTKAAAGYTDCLTFTGKTNEFTLKTTTKAWDGTLEWSTDHNTWTTLAGTETMQSVDKKLYLRGKGNTALTYYDDDLGQIYTNFKLSEKADCNGNIQTLLDCENPPVIINTNNCFEHLFAECANLTSAPELPATALKPWCYYAMFAGCTNLTTAPELPATTLAVCCYYDMFYGCANLITAPRLSATTLAAHCYNGMFGNCTSLTTAPELPATTLKESCYYSMFKDCTKLKVNTTSGNKIFTCPSTIPNDAVTNMFSNTGGTFTSTPTAGTTYYWAE